METKEYFVIRNNTTGMFISMNPLWNPYNEESVPNEDMAVSLSMEGAVSTLEDYDDYLERTINNTYEYNSVGHDMLVEHLKEAKLTIVKVILRTEMIFESC